MTADSFAEGHAYQQQLLALLGADDPAAVQRATPDALRDLIRDAGGDLRTRPADAEWSVLELIGHIADAELVCAGRYRWILAHDEPPLLGYDQDLWVEGLGHGSANPSDLLDLFESLRRADLALWERTPIDQRGRVGHHSERGPESYELTFRLIAGHDRFHLDQARRTLEQVRAGGMDSATAAANDAPRTATAE